MCLERRKGGIEGVEMGEDREMSHLTVDLSSWSVINVLSVDVPAVNLLSGFCKSTLTVRLQVVTSTAHRIRKTLGCFLLISLANYNKYIEYTLWIKGLNIKTQCGMKIRLINLKRKTSSVNAWHALENNGSHSRALFAGRLWPR